MTIIPHWLTKQAELSPQVHAIETPEGENVTFAELQQRSERFAKQLVKLGIQKGDHVGIFATNSVSMVVAIHAMSYIGAVGVFLNIRLTAHELLFQMKDAEVTAILTNEAMDNRLEAMQVILPVYSFAHVKKQQPARMGVQTELSLSDVYTIMYTSGTTGSPKGVVHTYGNHWWSAIGSALNLKLSEHDKWAASLPLFHVSGFSVCMRSVIYGMPIFLFEHFSAEATHRAIMENDVTIVSVVTVMVEQLLEELGDDVYPTSLRCMLLGGGAAPAHLLELGKKKNVPIVQSYGLTETASQFATLQASDALNKIGSSGKPLFPGQLKIEQPDADGIGEIVLKGPMVTKGYYKHDAINERAIKDGWLFTGDIGRVDDAGFLYVYERRSDLIISGGENIYPSEIEAVIRRVSGINEVSVVGLKDETWGSVPVACIVREDETLTVDQVLAAIKPVLAPYKIPKQIYFIPSLPRNATNKIMRHELQRLIQEGEIK